MYKTYHIKITRQAIGNSFSPHALEIITRSNLGQDDLAGQIGRPEFHFDDNKQEITKRLSTQALARFTGRLASIGPTAQ